MIADDLAAIVERAYALALDPALTDGWLADATRALGGTLGTLSVTEAGGDLVRQAMAFDRPAAIDRYVADGMIAFDPQIAYVRTLDRQTLYLDTDHRRDDDPQTAAFVSYVRSNLALDHHMTTIAPVRGRPLMAGLSINRAVGDGHTPRRERERLAAIARPLADAFSLAVAHADQLASSFWDGLASTAAEPALLIDERGRVMRLTAAAEKLLGRGDAIDIVAGRLRCGDGAADARLQHAIARAVRSPSGSAGGVRLPHRSGRVPLVVTVYPLPRSRRTLAPFEAAALVTIVDPLAATAPLDYSEVFGLSRSEAALARLLMAGHSVESAARVQGISLPTARLHLRRLLAKTGTTRQTDLVRLLGRL